MAKRTKGVLVGVDGAACFVCLLLGLLVGLALAQCVPSAEPEKGRAGWPNPRSIYSSP